VVFGGSVLFPQEPDPNYLKEVAERLQAWSRDHQLFVVAGGGAPARRHITLARRLQVAEEELDRIGIAATRLNAQFLQSVLHQWGVDVPPKVPTTVHEAKAAARPGRIVVMGGTEPGHSTDYVGVELAIAVGAERFINATNVDGVYTKDPKEHPDAEHKEHLSFEELLQIIEEEEWTTAGAPGVLDGPATVLIATQGLPTRVCDGRDLENLDNAVRGEPFHGTTVSGAKVVLGGAA
jgi:uridylate kinase